LFCLVFVMKAALPVSPLAPTAFPALPPVAGVRLGGLAVGLRYQGRPDVLVAVFDQPATAAGTLTRSLTASAAVDWCRQALASGRGARALVVNAGNANACTGARGEASVRAIAAAVAALTGSQPEQVYHSSTGVIGEPLDHPRLIAGVEAGMATLTANGWDSAARAIMTTDTFHKVATCTIAGPDGPVTLNGIAKGSGMIQPNMATMLGYVFTDAQVDPALWQQMVTAATDRSFNSITVDGDTSTSDTFLAFATGQRRVDAAALAAALDEVCRELALLIVRDGEGAEKLVTITVTGAESEASARQIGLTIANSPLVKTAIAGEDANWGRIFAAAGRAGVPIAPARLCLAMGGVVIARNGMRVDGYDETPVAAHLKGRDIRIDLDVGVGSAAATVWTCDLTARYLTINAGYRS
jgi:glutamate N-acetyltransferase/amino-acid N-acetyltransferase